MSRRKTANPAYTQLTFDQISQEAVTLNVQAMTQYLYSVAPDLTRKRLPMIYFKDAAERLDINPEICTRFKINRFPFSQTMDKTSIYHITAIYSCVIMQLSQYPKKETYLQAVNRFKARVKEILDRKEITNNHLALHLKVSHRTLTELISARPNPEPRHSHCPWAMLSRLETAAQDIMDQNLKRWEDIRAYKRIRPIDVAETEPEPPRPDPARFIGSKSSCGKCRASWTHLYHNGSDFFGNLIMHCQVCSQDNLVDINNSDESPPMEKEFIDRYGSCWNCQAPWHNLTQDGEDDYGNRIHTCAQCLQTNRIRKTAKVSLT